MIKEILLEYTKEQGSNFDVLYAICCAAFSKISGFHSIKALKYEDLETKWPKGVGVYAIWETKTKGDLLYIGMTGKIKKHPNGKTQLSELKNGFSKRGLRYHPYSFTQKGPFRDYFEYAPKHSLKSIQKAPLEDRYAAHIPLKDMKVDCFQIPQRLQLAPSFLEVLLLQSYFSSYNSLPIANNQL